MNRQLGSSTPVTMPLTVIPAAVTQLGPQLSRLPDELIHHIFKIIATTMFPPTSRFNTVINSQTFAILNRHYAIKRLRNVSPLFRAFFTEAFYEAFTFAFKHSSVFNLETDYLTSVPAPVPTPNLRHHLRSMRIDIALETYYFTRQLVPEFARTCRMGRTLRKIVTTTQMMTFCPSAHFLLQLTNEQYGFCHLSFLHLHIRMDDHLAKVDAEFLQVMQDMKFVVKAARVEIVVTDGYGFPSKKYDGVEERIAVVH